MGVEPLVNRKLGPYVILEVLGRGSMGVVYRALNEMGGCEVAVKTICAAAPNTEDAIVRFRREALWQMHCEAPHIAPVYDTGHSDGVDYIVMELMASTLAARMAAGPVPLTEVVMLGAQILMALSAAHQAGIIHRDVKPANIGLSRAGIVKLLDFGVAEALPCGPGTDESPTGFSPSPVVGSLPYIAPEQLRGDEVDARADVYGAGAVLYELATGRPPFQERTGARLIDAVLNRQPLPPSTFNPAVGRRVDRVILRAMAKKPSSRYRSASAMMDALLRHGHAARAAPSLAAAGCMASPAS